MNNDASWNTQSVRNAVSTIQDWLNKGYFPPHPEVDGDQESLYSSQKAVCWVTGNWECAYITKNVGSAFTTKIVPFPASKTCSDGGSQVNFVGGGYMVYSKSKNQKAALDYIDYNMANPSACKTWAEMGEEIPAYTGEYDPNTTNYIKTVRSYLVDTKISNIAGVNMWVGTKTFDFFSTAGQKMAIKAYNVDTFITALEKTRQEDVKEGNTKGSFKQ